MKWFLLIFPLGITYYTYTYGYSTWQKGNRRGAAGLFVLAAFALSLTVYALFFREYF